MIPRAPCMKDGIDCDKRYVGCHAHCEAYQSFRAEMDKVNAERQRQNFGADFACDMIWRDRQKLKHTAAGKRALAQR